jgi:enoyl-CoA hydratase
MDFQTIIYQQEGKAGIIRLNRPKRMNAVNETMYREIQDVLSIARSDENIRVLLITGSVNTKGTEYKQAFCAGADLKEHASGSRNQAGKKRYIKLAHDTNRRVFEFPKPTIAVINGPARGAGAELALNCDFLLMADSASLAFTETSLGTLVGGGITRHLPALVGLMKAKFLIYTGQLIHGKEAEKIGIALRSCRIEELMPLAMNLAGELAEKAPLSIMLVKKMLHQGGLLDLQTVLKNETESLLSCMETEDWHEGIMSFMEKRKPVFRGR